MKTIAKSAIAMASAVLATAALADVSFNANIETNSTQVSNKSLDNGGRVEVNAMAQLVKEGDNFVNAKSTIEVPLAGTGLNIADVWIHFGNSTADLKMGRFEAVDLFPLGKDVVVEGAGVTGGYRANALRGRFNTGQMHAAIGLNLMPGMRAELGVVTEKNEGDGAGKNYGYRPTLTYTTGALTLRAGVESISTQGLATAAQTGTALSVGYAVNSDTTLNFNLAKNSKAEKQSTGFNLVFGAAGLGLVLDEEAGKKQNTVYAAYSFPLLGIKAATITPALSRSVGTDVEGVTAVRVRMNYAF